MKIVHSADWHLGITSWRTQKAISRFEEQREVLETFLKRVRTIEPDVIILAGDILHHRSGPSVDVLRFLYWILNELRKVCPVVIVLGNHDWEGLTVQNTFDIDNLYIIRKFEPVFLDTNSGRLGIYPVPYVSGVKDILHGRGKTLEKLLELLNSYRSSVKRNRADYNVMVAHIMMSGYLPPFAEDRLDVVLDPNSIPQIFDYVALGHVHEFTKISDVPPTYYSGSVIQLDFSELADKGFVVFENGSVDFEKLPHKKLKILDLSGKCSDQKECMELIERGYEGADYLKLVLDSKNAKFIGKFMLLEKVVAVDIVREEKMTKKEFKISSLNFEDLLREYIRTRADDEEEAEKMWRYMEKILEDIRRERSAHA